MRKIYWLLVFTILFSSCSKSTGIKPANQSPEKSVSAEEENLAFPGEDRHIQNIKQLTTGGKNAEAYFSSDSRWLIYQSHNDTNSCDQMFVMKVDGSESKIVSTGKGRVTCGYFVDNSAAEDSRILYSSTHDHSENCPEAPNPANGYVWPIYTSYEIYMDNFKGGNLTRLTNNNFYDAEATVSPDGKEIVFTSTRDGDLDLYTMNVDGTNVRRLTRTMGYDGGAFFSPDGKQIVYRAYHPILKRERQEYTKLLKQNLYKPRELELYIMDRDGKNQKKVTDLHASSFAPFMYPGNNRIIFSSNLADPKGRFFDIFAVNTNGGFLEKITFNKGFDSFPMFSRDGKKIVWASTRNSKSGHDINIFVADWTE